MGEVLILHGWRNHRPEGHWQRWLAEELDARGHDVRYPQLPDADTPVRAGWLAALEAELVGTTPSQLTVVAHSLGCALWLAYAVARRESGLDDPAAARVILVSPPSDGFLERTPEISGFLTADTGEDDAVAAALAAASIAAPMVVQGDDDPVNPAGTVAFAEVFGLERVTVPGGGHLTIGDGYGPFPLVLDLVLDPGSPTG